MGRGDAADVALGDVRPHDRIDLRVGLFRSRGAHAQSGCHTSDHSRPVVAAVASAGERAVVCDDAIDVYTEGRSRVTNLVDGMGLALDIAQQDQLDGVDKDRYQLVIVAPTSDREFKLSEKAEQQIIAALGRGTNVLWIGGGILGTFQSPPFADSFCRQYVIQ